MQGEFVVPSLACVFTVLGDRNSLSGVVRLPIGSWRFDFESASARQGVKPVWSTAVVAVAGYPLGVDKMAAQTWIRGVWYSIFLSDEVIILFLGERRKKKPTLTALCCCFVPDVKGRRETRRNKNKPEFVCYRQVAPCLCCSLCCELPGSYQGVRHV